MSTVADLGLARVYDSRANPTVEATVITSSGARSRVGAPSGASTGAHEVQAFPEGGVPVALERFLAEVRPRLRGREVSDQAGWDAALHAIDGTPNFARIGGNTATALSLALAEAGASEEGVPLWSMWRRNPAEPVVYPAIVGNCLNGGRHAVHGPEFQEFIAFASSPDPADSVRAAIAVHRAIGAALAERFPRAPLGRGDEGGWVAAVGSLEALEILATACASVRDTLHLPVHPGLDLAASEFFAEGLYRYRDQSLDREGQVRFLADLVDRFELRYLEDPLDEEDFEGFATLNRAVGSKCLVVGDDLYVTNRARLERGLAVRASNAILIKVNQVGTLTDTFATIDLARSHGVRTVSSHRSGEVTDGWLAHLAVAAGSAGLKCGVLGGERVAKLNELLRLATPPKDTPR
jgi:enolase